MNYFRRILLIVLTVFYLFSCKTNNKQITKHEQIQYVIAKSGFIKLPLVFDASDDDALDVNYLVDFSSNDTLLFESGRFDIVGFFPDTTNYYAFLYLAIGDMLYPTIVTMDKNWQKIDEKIICTSGCLSSPLVEVTSCYNSVWIYKDLKIKSISKVIGTIEIDDDSTSQILNICNMQTLDGFIDKHGKIHIKESGLIDCGN